jgi:hypothetical protein
MRKEDTAQSESSIRMCSSSHSVVDCQLLLVLDPDCPAKSLTRSMEFDIVRLAAIHAQPLETLPQPESSARQRGAYSRIFIVILCVHHWRAAGEWPVVYPREI